MAIKNAYTGARMENIVSAIQKILVSHHAQKIMYDYDNNGQLSGLTFGIDINGKMFGVKLPARVKECETILRKQGLLSPSKKDNALRVAWANIRDWIDSQMAMVDIGMVKMEEIFLPYIVDGEKTVYEIYQQKFISLDK